MVCNDVRKLIVYKQVYVERNQGEHPYIVVISNIDHSHLTDVVLAGGGDLHRCSLESIGVAKKLDLRAFSAVYVRACQSHRKERLILSRAY
jgi:hypothetical protein